MSQPGVSPHHEAVASKADHNPTPESIEAGIKAQEHTFSSFYALQLANYHEKQAQQHRDIAQSHRNAAYSGTLNLGRFPADHLAHIEDPAKSGRYAVRSRKQAKPWLTHKRVRRIQANDSRAKAIVHMQKAKDHEAKVEHHIAMSSQHVPHDSRLHHFSDTFNKTIQNRSQKGKGILQKGAEVEEQSLNTSPGEKKGTRQWKLNCREV